MRPFFAVSFAHNIEICGGYDGTTQGVPVQRWHMMTYLKDMLLHVGAPTHLSLE